MSFQRMIAERKENKEPGAKHIKAYNVDDIDDYYDKHAKNLQVKAISQGVTPSLSSTPATPPPFKPYEKWMGKAARQLDERKKRQDPIPCNQGQQQQIPDLE